MSFDKPTRNALAKMVGECRRLLTADIRDQLQRVYGLQPDGTDLPVESLGHLDERGKLTAAELREWREHLASTEPGSDDRRRVAAFDRLAHETAFTALNRLAALRLCEERGHVIECVRRATESDGFKLFERLSGGALGSRATTYRTFLEMMFDELAVDLGVLFDRAAPQSLVFASERCLERVLEVLNESTLVHVWQDDETIGWIYQYFNGDEPAEMRKAAKGGPPRNSRELAVRNQFFTPRYVVEFLTDNTLGRLWYEMRRGETRLVDFCRNLVRRPVEIFLELGQEPPEDQNSGKDLSQEELLRKPVYVPFRPKKDPRDVKILDPACGSGHFLLYAFDLLEAIYEEAWNDEQSPPSEISGKTLHEDYPDLDLLRRDTPSFILRHNLHGIDIDPRCSQIAALALWLRAQRRHQGLGLKAGERPQITRSNIVCAEPMPGDADLLETFLAGLKPPLLSQLVRAVFEKMHLAGEAGSLLKVEQEIRGALDEARRQWIAGPAPEQLLLLPEAGKRTVEQLKLFDVSGISDETFWEEAEARVIEKLSAYAIKAVNDDNYRRRLFADDAAHGFAFIDLCRQRYDVVLMNPPFGEPAFGSTSYINRQYPKAFIDVLAAFVERAKELCTNGRIGALTSRACLYTKTLAEWRNKEFLPAIEAVADLGGGVLDGAMVFACASVFASPASSRHVCCAFDFRKSPDRQSELIGLVEQLFKGDVNKLTYVKDRRQLAKQNSARFLYNIPDAFWNWSRDSMNLVTAGGSARAGSTTYDDFRFLRLVWEVPVEEIGWEKYWVLFSKGGYFETFYNDIHLLVNWLDGGREVGEFNRIGYGTDAQSKRASTFYRRPAVTYPRRTVKGFSPRALPRDCIFADKGPAIFAPDNTDLAFALGYWNSAPIRALVHLQVQAGSFETGVINTVPWLKSPTASKAIAAMSQSVWRKKAAIYSFWEVDRGFVPPQLAKATSLAEFSEHLQQQLSHNSETVVSLCRQISDVVSRAFALPEIDLEAFEVSPEDHVIQEDFGISESGASAFYVCQLAVGCAFGRWDVRFATGDRPPPALPDPFASLPTCPPGQLQTEQGLLTKSEVQKSGEEWNYPIDIPWDGILVDDPGHSLDIENRIRQVLQIIWKEHWESIEREACEILGVRTLRDWFRRPAAFFGDHLKRYSKSRRQAPIYWPLSTASGSYTLWLYYHRLTDQTLFACVNDFIEPKLNKLEKSIAQFEEAKRTTDLQVATELYRELEDFKHELLILAPRWKPNLNDGVLVTAAPLWKLFRLPKWRRDLEECWKKLEAGEYDWAHLGYAIWPERVRQKCKSDRSLAIAHGLEDLCDFKNAQPSSKRRGRAAGKANRAQQTRMNDIETQSSDE